MKYFITIIIIFSLTSDSFSITDYWNVWQSPTSKNLKKCFFINSATGWACGDSGIIINTTNAGSNWNVQQTGIFSDINSIFFIDSNTGWATSWNFKMDSVNYPGTIILKTTNGGNNWSRSMMKDTNTFYSNIYFLNSQKGFLGGFPHFIIYTLNGGVSWDTAASDSISVNGLPVENISFMNSLTGYACGGAQDFVGIVWKTINGGFNWRPYFVGIDAIYDMVVASQDTFFAASGDFKFGAAYFKSVDAGQNWTYNNLGYVGKVTSIAFRNKSEGWMTVGYQQKFFLTTDRGISWTILDPPVNSSIFDFCFPDSLNGWAVGADGRILKYNYLVNVHSNEIALNKQFNLFQNYPNPFNPVTNLGFGISELGFASLRVYNSLGEEVAVLINENKFPGNYDVQFDGTDFPSGIYFYRLEVDGNIIDTKRMVLLK